MISGTAITSVLIVSQIARAVELSANRTAPPNVLSTIDQAISACALLVLSGLGIWWVARSRRDPLADAPQRANKLRDDALLFVVMIYLLGALAISGLTHLLGSDKSSAFVRLATGSSAQLIGIGACLAVAAGRFEGGIRGFCLGSGDFRIRHLLVVTLVVALLAVGVCPLVLEASMGVIKWIAPGHEFQAHPTIDALHDPVAPLGAKIVLWLGAAVIAPIAEEAFFRGLLQTFLVNLVRNRWMAVLVASLAFSCVHVSQAHAIPALTVLAVLIGYSYERTGSLVPAVAIHAMFNLKTLLWDSLGAFPV